MYQLASDKDIPKIKEDSRHSEASPEDMRVVEVLRDDGNHLKILFRNLKEGDVFSLFDTKTKLPIKDKYGNITYVSSTDAYLAKHQISGKTVYHIQIKDMPPKGE